MPPDGQDDLLDAGFFILVPDEAGLQRRVPKRANIVRIHDAHLGMGRRFHDMFAELMYRNGPLTRSQRELIATAVSSVNACHY